MDDWMLFIFAKHTLETVNYEYLEKIGTHGEDLCKVKQV